MEIKLALEAFEALSHETRLAVFRALVKAGPQGLAAGELASRLDVLQNTLSSHLNKLLRAGIVTNERRGRLIIYRADFDVVRDLILFLMKDCCRDEAEVCKPIAASMSC